MPINKGLFTSNNPAYETPKEFYNKYNSKYNFTLDACASDTNHLCDNYYTVNNSCLDKDWTGETVWANVPYGRGIEKFMKKIYEEMINHDVVTVALIPSRTGSKWFQDWVLNKADIEFIKGRLHFCQNGIPDKNGAPFDSVIAVYENEKWKDLVGYDFNYKVSNKGNIMMADGHTTKGYINQDGYYKITLRKDNKNITKLVHRLVAEAFITNPDNKTEIDHLDANKLNNNYRNLKWSTRQEQFENTVTLENIKNQDNSRYISIQCIETGVIYKTIEECCKKNNLCATSFGRTLKRDNIVKRNNFSYIAKKRIEGGN